MEETLLSVMYEVPSRKDVERVVITPAVVNKESEPQYIPRAIGSKRGSKPKATDGDEAESA
jgi:ATP-dependent Clp protease ATP-binding subunit ClpX